MEKRKFTKIQTLKAKIVSMHEDGKTHREIAEYFGLEADTLMELDLAYAPPYSYAKDPVNMAGFMIDNIEKGILAWYGYEAYNFAGGFRFYDAVVNDRRLTELASACRMDQYASLTGENSEVKNSGNH